ncbi:MAG: glycosyltransferase family protein [Chlamydiia bacterium]|nr:glycosyltransferase family protein [Chlamydiia bacterium]
MKVYALVQARVGSERFPAKVLARARGKTLIERVLERLSQAASLEGIVLAIPDLKSDDALASYWPSVVRGAAEDVLARFWTAVKLYPADAYVRITADCPLTDPKVVDQLVAEFSSARADYASNTLERTYPRGFDVEIFTHALLERAQLEAVEPWDREHVTPYIARHAKKTATLRWKNNASKYRLCVDTPKDLQVVEGVLEGVEPSHPHFGVEEVVAFCDSHPELMRINADEEQRKPTWN